MLEKLRPGASDFLRNYPPTSARIIFGYVHRGSAPQVPLRIALEDPTIRRRVLMDLKDIHCVQEGYARLTLVFERLSDNRLFAATDGARLMKSYLRSDQELHEMSLLTSTYIRQIEVNGKYMLQRVPLILGLADVIRVEHAAGGLESFLLQLSSSAHSVLAMPPLKSVELPPDIDASQLFALAILETYARLFSFNVKHLCNRPSFLTIGINLSDTSNGFIGVGGNEKRSPLSRKTLSPQDYLFAWKLQNPLR